MEQTTRWQLADLYDQHADALWRHVVRLTGTPSGADDIVQETLLRAWTKRRSTE